MDDYFAGDLWTDERFWTWLAGHFEHGGHIRLPPETLAVSLSLRGKHEGIVHAIQRRVHAGETRARFTATPTFVWRVHSPSEIERVLTSLLPFFTIYRDAAYEALDRVRRRQQSRDARDVRDREICIAWERGNHSQAEIAAQLNTTSSVVAQVIARNRVEHGIRLRRPRTRIR